jgi:tetratricopeptide (TPR) repeat protein
MLTQKQEHRDEFRNFDFEVGYYLNDMNIFQKVKDYYEKNNVLPDGISKIDYIKNLCSYYLKELDKFILNKDNHNFIITFNKLIDIEDIDKNTILSVLRRLDEKGRTVLLIDVLNRLFEKFADDSSFIPVLEKFMGNISKRVLREFIGIFSKTNLRDAEIIRKLLPYLNKISDLIAVADQFKRNEFYKDALLFYERALETKTKLDNRKMNIYRKISNIYWKQNDYKTTIYYLVHIINKVPDYNAAKSDLYKYCNQLGLSTHIPRLMEVYSLYGKEKLIEYLTEALEQLKLE